jgi:radical SAM-linked protein
MKIRVRFSKVGKIRWTSHRDLARMWERAFRRIELPLAYSVGFSPRPKVSFGLALSTGHESVAEFLDLELDSARIGPDFDVSTLPQRLTAALPAGIDVRMAAVIDDRADSLQHEVTSCGYEIVAAGATIIQLRAFVAEALAADSLVITRERKGQPVTDDVRPAIVSLVVVREAAVGEYDTDDGDERQACVVLEAELATQPRGLRPAELLVAISPVLEEVRVRRLIQWISRADGAREEPLPLDALGEPPALQLERVS